jgi:hypothetical protein
VRSDGSGRVSCRFWAVVGDAAAVWDVDGTAVGDCLVCDVAASVGGSSCISGVRGASWGQWDGVGGGTGGGWR